MAQRVRRRQDDDRAARPSDSPLRHRGNRQRQLALQKPRRRSHNPRSPRLRNPGQLRRGERYRQTAPLKGVKIGRRYGVKFERRLTIRRIIHVIVAPGSVTNALLPLRMARKLDPYRETARMALEPWLVEAALARLLEPLSPADQRIVVKATRTPRKVRWPDWWSEHP